MPTVAIRDITVVDVRDGSLHRDHTVLLAGNRIAAEYGPLKGPSSYVAISADSALRELRHSKAASA
jgi:hypothetical protein